MTHALTPLFQPVVDVRAARVVSIVACAAPADDLPDNLRLDELCEVANTQRNLFRCYPHIKVAIPLSARQLDQILGHQPISSFLTGFGCIVDHTEIILSAGDEGLEDLCRHAVKLAQAESDGTRFVLRNLEPPSLSIPDFLPLARIEILVPHLISLAAELEETSISRQELHPCLARFGCPVSANELMTLRELEILGCLGIREVRGPLFLNPVSELMLFKFLLHSARNSGRPDA